MQFAGQPGRKKVDTTWPRPTPAEFVQQVRQETDARHLAHPQGDVGAATTAMVFVMVFVAAAFFFVVDQVIVVWACG